MSRHRHGRGRGLKASETRIDTGPDGRWLRHWTRDEEPTPTNDLPGHTIGHGTPNGITLNGRNTR